MHYHCEVWVPEKPASYEEAAELVEGLLWPFNENNPGSRRAKFCDYAVLGGRYTGSHDDYDPGSDARNYERCSICKGTGERGDYQNQTDRNFMRGCNSCNGTGLSMKFRAAPHDGDIMALKDVPDEMTAYTLLVTRKRRSPEVYFIEEWDGTKESVKVFLRTELGITDGYLITVDYHC
jgi:hypothetical protein